MSFEDLLDQLKNDVLNSGNSPALFEIRKTRYLPYVYKKKQSVDGADDLSLEDGTTPDGDDDNDFEVIP